MSTLEIILLSIVGTVAVAAIVAFLLLRHVKSEARRVMSRVSKLPWRAKLQLAVDLARDDRIPAGIRFLPPIMLLYLALPVDLIPDFIPFFGQLDDVVMLALGAGLILRFVPRQVIDERLTLLEESVALQRYKALPEPDVTTSRERGAPPLT
jgi:uncharacterized membrane protein YkvA (DUF1232 family)